MNCGVCPTATNNTSITCVVDDVTTVIDNLCILSIQSVVCGVTGENRSNNNVTAPLRGIATVLATKCILTPSCLLLVIITVPGSPQLSVLPYYDSTSRELKKIDIQIMTDSSVSE